MIVLVPCCVGTLAVTAAPAHATGGYCGHDVGGMVDTGGFSTGINQTCVLHGPGTFEIADGVPAAVSSVVLQDDLRLLNNGAISAPGDGSHWELKDSSVVENAATWNQLRRDRVYLTGPSTSLFHNDSGAVVDANAGSMLVQLPTTNDGAMLAYKGYIDLPQLTNLSDGVLTGGVYGADNEASIELPGPVTSNAADVSVTRNSHFYTPNASNPFSQLGVNSGSYLTDSPQTVGALDNSGSLTINGSGAFTSTQPVTLRPSGHLAVGIDRTTSADKIHTSGPVQVGGTLAVTSASSLRPVPGHHYVIASSDTGLTGTFSAVQGLDGLTRGQHYALSYTAKSVSLVVIPRTPIPLGVSSIAPTGIGQNATDLPMTVHGSGFVDGALVGFGNSDVLAGPSTVVDNTTLTVMVSAGAAATIGPRDVKVRNPGGSVAVCGGCLQVDPPPRLQALSGPVGIGAVQAKIRLAGSGLAGVPQVSITGAANSMTVTANAFSSAAANLFITVPVGTTLGAYTLQWRNPDGGSGTCAGCLTVVAPPTVTGISPDVVNRGSSVDVTISGTGFVTGATVSSGPGTSYTGVTVVNPTTITATLTVNGRPAAGPAPVTVTNGPAGGYGVGSVNGLTFV